MIDPRPLAIAIVATLALASCSYAPTGAYHNEQNVGEGSPLPTPPRTSNLTRAEVSAEAAAANRAGTIPGGER
jgi:hypothetical protein